MRLGRFAVALAALCTLILAQTTSAVLPSRSFYVIDPRRPQHDVSCHAELPKHLDDCRLRQYGAWPADMRICCRRLRTKSASSPENWKVILLTKLTFLFELSTAISDTLGANNPTACLEPVLGAPVICCHMQQIHSYQTRAAA